MTWTFSAKARARSWGCSQAGGSAQHWHYCLFAAVASINVTTWHILSSNTQLHNDLKKRFDILSSDHRILFQLLLLLHFALKKSLLLRKQHCKGTTIFNILLWVKSLEVCSWTLRFLKQRPKMLTNRSPREFCHITWRQKFKKCLHPVSEVIAEAITDISNIYWILLLADIKCQSTAEHALAAGLALLVSSATVAPVLGWYGRPSEDRGWMESWISTDFWDIVSWKERKKN